MKLATLSELNAERAARRPVIVVTDVASGEQRMVKADAFARDPLQAELAKQLRMGKSGMIEAGGKKLFLNVYAPTARLVIIGAVHISQALAPMAKLLGYDVTIVDPRTAFASIERFPDVTLVGIDRDAFLVCKRDKAFKLVFPICHCGITGRTGVVGSLDRDGGDPTAPAARHDR